MDKIRALLGRLLVLILYCSTFFIIKETSFYYTSLIAKEVTEQFLEEAYESGVTLSNYTTLVKVTAPLGYTVNISIESPERSFTKEELLTFIREDILEVTQKDFITCTLTRNRETIRIGGMQ